MRLSRKSGIKIAGSYPVEMIQINARAGRIEAVAARC
jgi:hypothetical protein